MGSQIIYEKMDWMEFLSGSAAGAVITEVGRYIREKRKNKIDLTKNAQDMAEITNQIFPSILENTLFNRVMIFKATNSAGVIAPGKILKVTAIYEDVRDLDRIIDDIQEWKADNHYYKIFSDVLTQGQVQLITDEMPDSKLKTIYKNQGIKYSEIYHLTTTPDNSKVFYISIASSMVGNASSEARYYIDVAVDKLRNIFDAHKKVL